MEKEEQDPETGLKVIHLENESLTILKLLMEDIKQYNNPFNEPNDFQEALEELIVKKSRPIQGLRRKLDD